MGYEIALNRAWDALAELAPGREFAVLFLGVVHEVMPGERKILILPAGALAQEDAAILILHYLIGLKKHGYKPTGEWISFREVEGGALFYPNYRDSVLVPLAEIFGRDPEGLIRAFERRGGRKVDGGDAAVEIDVLPNAAVRAVFWKGDEDFNPEAVLLFDRALAGVVCMEDIAVMLHLLAQMVITGGDGR